MPTDPSQEILDYFQWKAQNVPTGVPLDEVSPDNPPQINLNIPPLGEDAYQSNKSTIFDYVNQEYIDQAGLKNNVLLNVDELNTKFQTDLSQNVLDKTLDEFIKRSGGNNTAIYSSHSYAGFMSADLKDYLKITLRKPSSKDERAIERRVKGLKGTTNILGEIPEEFVENMLTPLLGEEIAEQTAGVGGGVADTTGNIAFIYTQEVINLFSESLGVIDSPISEETLKEIYGDDGVVDIFLPLPKEIIEVYAHAIEQAELGGLRQLNAAMTFAGAETSVLKAIAGRVFPNSSKIIQNLKMPGASNFITGVQQSMDFVSADTRKAYNPVQEQLYRTPLPRAFQWTISIMPTTQEQARSTAAIIQALKEHSSPINMGDVLYDFPGFIEFEFYINNKLAKFLPRSLYYSKERKIKVPSFIRSLNIEYSSNNMYSHFVDNYPTNYTIIIDIIESQPLDRNIIMGDNDNNSTVKYIDGVNAFFNDSPNQ